MKIKDVENTAITGAIRSGRAETVTCLEMSRSEARNLIDRLPDDGSIDALAEALDTAQGEAHRNGCEAYVVIQVWG